MQPASHNDANARGIAMDGKMRGGFVVKVECLDGYPEWDELGGVIRILIKTSRDASFVDISPTNVEITTGMWMAVKGNNVYLCPRGRFTKHTHVFERVGGGG